MEKANFASRVHRLISAGLGYFVLSIGEFLAICTLPHVAAFAMMRLGISYEVGRSYVAMPSVVSWAGDKNYATLSQAVFDSFPTYFVLARMAMYYLVVVLMVMNVALAIWSNFGASIVAKVEGDVSRQALWGVLLICTVVVFAGPIWGFLSIDSLGVKHRDVGSGGVTDGFWWLTWPTSFALGVLCTPVIVAVIKKLNTTIG